MNIVQFIMPYITIENVLAVVGAVSIIMTGVPIPQAGTKLFKLYKLVSFIGGNFGKADHTKKE